MTRVDNHVPVTCVAALQIEAVRDKAQDCDIILSCKHGLRANLKQGASQEKGQKSAHFFVV